MARARLRACLDAIARWLTVVEGPQTYALLRIGLGALVLANVSTLWPHLDYLYGDLGVAPAARVCGEGMARLSILCHLPATWGPPAFLVVFTAAALALTLGLAPRASCILTVALYAALGWRSQVSFAGEHVFGDFLFLLCFARCGEAYAIDAWLRGRPRAAVPSWPRYLMVVQLALCLGVNGWAKSGETWRSGEAVFYVLAHDRFHRFPPWAMLHALGPAFTRALTWGSLVIERGFPLVVLGLLIRPQLRRWHAPGLVQRAADWLLGRRVWAPLAVSMMLGITTLLNVGWFVPATAVAVLCLFRGEELGRVRPTSPQAPAATTWRVLLIAGFMLWHGSVIVTRSLLSLTGELLAAPLASCMQTYERWTGTTQFWRMFSPDVSTKGQYLRVVATTADGQRFDTPSDLDLLAHGRGIRVGYDRRNKIYATMLDPKAAKRREAHGRWVCHTWRSDSGEPARSVSMIRVSEPLPLPAWMSGDSADDPHDTILKSSEVEQSRVDCP